MSAEIEAWWRTQINGLEDTLALELGGSDAPRLPDDDGGEDESFAVLA